MSNIKVREKDKQALVDLVREEIDNHINKVVENLGETVDYVLKHYKDIKFSEIDNLPELSSNQELGDLLDVHPLTTISYLKSLPIEQRNYRTKVLKSQFAKILHEVYGSLLSRQTQEQRSKAGKKGYQKGLANLTQKQRYENGVKGGKKCIELHGNQFANLTQKQRYENGVKGGKRTVELHGPFANLTPKQRSENGKKIYELGVGVHGRTKEQMTEDGKKAFLAAQKQPNGVEGILIKVLDEQGLYVEDKKYANNGQIYYPGLNGNKFFKKFENGKFKLPDFKVKGQNKIIEIYGKYHHSKEFCEKRELPDYSWNPERLIEEYNNVGIECKVYWDSEIRDQKKLTEIVQEIKDWIK